jgi:hypothetical protein
LVRRATHDRKGDSDYEFEDDLETAAVLADMVQAKLDGIKTVADVRRSEAIRPAVRVMLEHYVAGRHLGLLSVAYFTSASRTKRHSRVHFGILDEKRKAAIETAREQGIDLVFDEEDDD